MMPKTNKVKRLSYISILTTVILGLGLTVSSATAGEVPAKKVTQKDKTGTNPAGFANKFTPYYTYTERDNNEFSLWLAPELGKLLSKQLVMYAKPGWGIVKDDPTRS